MKSNKSISRKTFLTQIRFLQFQKWPKYFLWKLKYFTWFSWKIFKTKFHEFFFIWTFLIFWPTVPQHCCNCGAAENVSENLTVVIYFTWRHKMVGGSNHTPPDPSTNCPKCNANTLLALLFENCNALQILHYFKGLIPIIIFLIFNYGLTW